MGGSIRYWLSRLSGYFIVVIVISLKKIDYRLVADVDGTIMVLFNLIPSLFVDTSH